MTEHILVAVIAALPPTLAAFAAWKKSDKTNKKLITHNGHTVGQLTEASYELTKATSHRLDEVSKALECHIVDQHVHCDESRVERLKELIRNETESTLDARGIS